MGDHTRSRPQKNLKSTSESVVSETLSRTDSDLRFFILKPNGHRRLWAIQAYKEPVRGDREYQKRDTQIFKELSDRCIPVNQQYLAGKMDEQTARDLLNEVITSYLSRGDTLALALKRVRLSSANEAVLKEFWEHRYAHKMLVDEKSAYADFSRALRLIGDLSVLTAEPKYFTQALKKNTKNVSQHRRAVSSLNEIFKFIDRDIRLTKPEEELFVVSYLTEAEVFRLAETAPSREFKLFTLTLFGTGARSGEAVAIDEAALGNKAVHITKQIPLRKRKDAPAPKPKKPKRGKTGWVIVLESCWEYVKEWAALDTTEFDRRGYYEWIVMKSRALWPTNPVKHITAHDLRHAHAIHILSKGKSMRAVATQLRNRTEICEKYYAGFQHNPESLDALRGTI